jgi:hypothetical protein
MEKKHNLSNFLSRNQETKGKLPAGRLHFQATVKILPLRLRAFKMRLLQRLHLRLLKASDAFLVHNSKLSEENKIEIFILTLDDEMIWTC